MRNYQQLKTLFEKCAYRSDYATIGSDVIRNGTDIVTHCPPRLLGFRDMGEMIEIEGDLSAVADDMWDCVKYHFPQCVADGLGRRMPN